MSNNLPKLLKNFRLFIDGYNTDLSVESIQLPKISHTVESANMGFFKVPVQLGLEALSTEFTLVEHKGLELWGRLGGVGALVGNTLHFRGYQDNNNSSDLVEVIMRGCFKNIDLGTITRGQKCIYKISGELTFFSYAINNVPIIIINPLTNTYTISFVNQIRENLKILGLN